MKTVATPNAAGASSPGRGFAKRAATVVLMAGFGGAVPATAASIVEIHATAVRNDPVLANARATNQIAKEGVALSRGALLPSANANASRSQGRSVTEPGERLIGGMTVPVPGRTTDTSNNSWGVSVSQTLFNVANWFQYQGSRASARQADWDLQAALQELVIRVSQAYLGVLRTQAALESTRAAEQAVRRQLDQVQQRFDVGLVAITDVLDSKAEYDASVVTRIQAEGNHDNSFESLRTLTGQPITAVDRLTEELPIVDPAPASEAEWVAAAMAGSARIQGARESLGSAKENLKAAFSAPLPTISASISYGGGDGSSAFNGQVFQDPGSSSVSYSVSLQAPLFQGLREYAGMRRARLAVEQARQNLLRQELSVAESVRNLFRTVKVDVVRVQARAESIKSAKAALEATQTGYDVGTRNVVDVLLAQRRLFQSQFDHASSRYDYVLNLLRLKQAVGSLSEQDIKDLSAYSVTEDPIRPTAASE